MSDVKRDVNKKENVNCVPMSSHPYISSQIKMYNLTIVIYVRMFFKKLNFIRVRNGYFFLILEKSCDFIDQLLVFIVGKFPIQDTRRKKFWFTGKIPEYKEST
jgi:hypothetical protein